MQSGEEIETKIMEVNPTQVKYTLYGDSEGSIYVSMPSKSNMQVARRRFATVLLDYSIKYSLWQKINDLIEDMFSAIHSSQGRLQAAKLLDQFKLTRAVFAYN